MSFGLSVNTNAEATDKCRSHGSHGQSGSTRFLTKEAAVDELYQAMQHVLSVKVMNSAGT